MSSVRRQGMLFIVHPLLTFLYEWLFRATLYLLIIFLKAVASVITVFAKTEERYITHNWVTFNGTVSRDFRLLVSSKFAVIGKI